LYLFAETSSTLESCTNKSNDSIHKSEQFENNLISDLTKIENERDAFIRIMQEPITDIFSQNKNVKQPIDSTEEFEFNEEINQYTDTLTSWLCDLLNSLHKNIEFELFELENEGLCIRYSPLEHANIYGTNIHDLHVLNESFNDIVAILDASIKCRSTFVKEIKQFQNLSVVNVPKWAGIGAVRYIPDYLLDKIDEINKYLMQIKLDDKNEDKKSLNLIDLDISNQTKATTEE
jgi:hypothetical protein